VPPDVVGQWPVQAARLLVTLALGLVLTAVWRENWRGADDVALLRLGMIPLGAYLLLTTTLHPWYVTLIIPLLPFLASGTGEAKLSYRLILPWLYFSAAVPLSYLTYLDLDNLREYEWVRLIEYVPLYLLLIRCAWPASASAGGPDTG
jgi:hypothetical protein